MRWNVDRVFSLAQRKGWNDAELGRRMGYAQSTIWRIRHGRNQPSLAFREALKLAFPGVDPDTLMCPDNPRKRAS